MLIMVSAVDSPQFYDSDSAVAGPIQVRAYYCSSVFCSGLVSDHARTHPIMVGPLRSPKVSEAGLQGLDASLPPCVAAMCLLLMMGDTHPNMARQSTAMLPSRLDGPSVGC